MPPLPRKREVRLALVLNGGVSLAIWIGGVTKEVDAARRATPSGDDDTQPLYAGICEALDQRVVVDVIGGASAGGINGALLGAAIYNNRPLELRETWISLGDFRRLLRSPTASDPPSLMQGDDVVLAELRSRLDDLWRSSAQLSQPALHVYVTATDLYGFPVRFHDSEGRTWNERDHRRVFEFRYTEDPVVDIRGTDPNVVMPRTVEFTDSNAKELLAHAARGSSSFPVAFEAHFLRIQDSDGTPHDHWLVDGGILDNQPFNPVLDRIAVLRGLSPVKRVVMYVVPYVTESTPHDYDVPPAVTARETYNAAATLPRDLPKLQSLERITKELDDQRLDAAELDNLFTDLSEESLEASAIALLPKYRATRFAGSRAVYRAWESERFPAGDGVIAQDAAVDPGRLVKVEAPPAFVPPVPWIPDEVAWSPADPTWRWGLSPGERVAAAALHVLRNAATPEEPLLAARVNASTLVAWVRRTKVLLRQAYGTASPTQGFDDQIVAKAATAYATIADPLLTIQAGFAGLEPALLGAAGIGVKDLLELEIVRNAFGIRDIAPRSAFEFVFASAGVKNSLGHPAKTPDRKLAGMKLNHFAGFLKRSWRANDWLWGRLDGVEHLLRSLVDEEQIRSLTEAQAIALADVAFPNEQAEFDVLTDLWDDTLRDYELASRATGTDARMSFANTIADAAIRPDARLAACRRALAARIQLRILRTELGRVAQTAREDVLSGSSRIAAGAFWAGRVPDHPQPGQLLALFRDLDIGAESLADEASSRHVMDVGSHAAAVAASLIAGSGGGLPTAARGALTAVRTITLALSRLLRLLAREPAVGAATFAVLVGLVVWAATTTNTIIGALLPTLVILAVAMSVAVLTLATSVMELSPTRISRIAAFAFFGGVPLAFVLVVRWPDLSTTVSSWLDIHMGKTGTTLAVSFAAAAVAAAVLRLAFGLLVMLSEDAKKRRFGTGWIRTLLAIYRLSVLGSLASLGVGFIVMRTLRQHASKSWVSVADERRGTIFILAVVAALLLAGLIETTLAQFRVTRFYRAVRRLLGAA